MNVNDEGIKAVNAYVSEITRRCPNGVHEPLKVCDVVNEYLSNEGLTANVKLAKHPVKKTPMLVVYSGLDADFDFEGYVDINDNSSQDIILNVVGMIGINCYKN